MQLKDLKIIVTGGGGGMGAHFATRLHEAGAKVCVGDINEAGFAALPAGINKRKLDVSNEEDIGAFVAWAYDTMGGLNGLINNAGILKDGLLVKSDKTTGAITKMSLDQFNAVIKVNLTGATHDGARGRRQDGREGAEARRHRQHVVDRPPRQPRPVELRLGQGGARGQHRHLGARVRPVRHPRRRGGPRHGRDPDDRRHEPEGARRLHPEDPGRPRRQARGPLAGA